MRLLRFDFRDDLNSVDLHPLITVVSGLEPTHQRQLFEAVRRLSSGSTVGLRGLVEHQGLLVELDAGTGDPLGSVATSATVLVYVDGLAVSSDEVGLQAEIDQWERQAAIDAVTVEEIRSDLDLGAKAKAYELRCQADPGHALSGAAASPRKLMIRTIRRAFADVIAHEPEVSECDPGVLALLERWDGYCRLRAEAEEHLFQIAAEVERAQQAVVDRSADLDNARRAARPVLLTPEQEARLEALSDASNAAESTSLLGKLKRNNNDDGERERQALLDIVGVKSWTEYSVFRMSPTASPENLAVVAEAELALQQATQALQETRQREAGDPVVARLHQELERIKVDAQPYLGVLVPNDIGGALREQIVQVENPDWIRAANNLRDALSSNDLHPPYGLDPNELLGWTDSWLRAQESLDGASEVPEPSPLDDPAASEEVAQQTEATTRQLARHNRALIEIDRAERAAVRSAMRVRDLRNQLRTRSGGPEVTTAAAVLAMIAPVAEQILRDVGGSLPVAVVGDLAGLPEGEVEAMMGALEEVAQQVQVLLVTGHRGVATWVERAGLHRAFLAAGIRSQI